MPDEQPVCGRLLPSLCDFFVAILQLSYDNEGPFVTYMSRRAGNLQYEPDAYPAKEHSDDPSEFLVLSHQSEVESMER